MKPFHKNLLSLICVAAVCALVAQCSHAQTVKLAWDASPTTGVSYRLYAHTNSLSKTNLAASVVKVDVGTNLVATVDQIQAGKWWFTVTAVSQEGLESLPSNVVQAEVPVKPDNMRTVVVQFSGTITNGWQDVGFFRIKLE